MLKKILVALDLLKSNESVFQSALDLAMATGSSLMLLHVLSGDRDTGPTMPISTTWDYYAIVNDRTWKLYQSQWRDYEQRGLEILRDYTHRASKAGVPTEFTQIANSPGRAICTLANTWAADLVVVGSHGRRGLSELLLGSVSNYVVHHAHCSVFVVNLSQVATTASADNFASDLADHLDDAQPSELITSDSHLRYLSK
jgi:nucleotide-binding universal stress UspA family protein